MENEYTVVKKVIHGQEVDVKVYRIGLSKLVNEDELDELIELFNRADNNNVTVKKTGMEHYLRQPE
jgi:hypothetical protein